uniref:Uncharacterized protein n=1 Tax=Arion vulgaris TaxID=1028688 RepID=A0A0B7B6Y1_9EUPU
MQYEDRIRGFERKCLRKICWDQRILNTEIIKRTGINNINEEIINRKWLRHRLKMQEDQIPQNGSEMESRW